jgi:hypothetical protein
MKCQTALASRLPRKPIKRLSSIAVLDVWDCQNAKSLRVFLEAFDQTQFSEVENDGI